MTDPNQPNMPPEGGLPPGDFQQPQPHGQQHGQPYGQQPPQQPYGQQPPPYGQAPGQPQGQPAGGIGRPGELADRFFARLIDFLVIAVAGYIVIGVVVVNTLMGGSYLAYGLGGGNFLTSLVSSVLMAALYLGYFAYFESSRGQTLGKMVMKLETRGPEGGRPTMEQAVKRNIWVALGVVGVVPIVGGLLAGVAQLAAMIMIAVGINGDRAGRRGWHDDFADKTQVVKIG